MRSKHLVAVLAAAVIAVPVVADATPRAGTSSHTSGELLSVDRALGNGLGRLLQQSAAGAGRQAGGLRIDQGKLGIRDSIGRIMVDVAPRPGVDRLAFRRSAEAQGLSVRHTDATTGTLEGFVALSSVPNLAGLSDTATVSQELKPSLNTGSVTSQGVVFQRVDKVLAKGINGKGITVAALSDSFDTATTTIAGDPLSDHYEQDQLSGDLPGPHNKHDKSPVVVLEDEPGPGTTDEGRAMLQIMHDVAPAAKLCFATAFSGELGFADNIRKLADKKGPCGADIIVDDVSYFDEPFFSDGPVANAVNAVTAEGVSYFSAAGNDGDRSSWQSRIHLVPASQGAKGSNLDLSKVPAELYSGGLQDMNPGAGTDVAQTVDVDPAGGLFDMQWDDPFDRNGPTLGSLYYHTRGDLTKAEPARSFTFTPTAAELGKQVQVKTDAIPSGTTDLILTVTKPDGTQVGPVDTGASPEVAPVTLDQAGKYTITVTGFAGATGDFTVDIRPILAPTKVTTDLNLLIFGMNGSFLTAVADDNLLGGLPDEIASLPGLGRVQIAISRAGTGPFRATTVRWIGNQGAIQAAEYADNLTPSIFGHPTARGATAVAAYNMFRPNLPEYFTSPGGELPIYFDSNGNRFPKVQIRQKPDLASTDGGNTTFFANDTSRDTDTLPNFFGTSAAAPHAAAIAGLLLQRAGGPGSMTPGEVRRRLQVTTFNHDLDPDFSAGTAPGLSIKARGGQTDELSDLTPGSMTSRKFFTVHYSGRVPLRSLTLYGETADPTARGLRNPPVSDGLVFDNRPFTGAPFSESGFPFTIGATGGGLAAGSVSATFSVPAGGLGVAGQYRHLTLHFAHGLRRGQTLQFGIDRDQQTPPYMGFAPLNGDSADELGGATAIPSRVTQAPGMRFTAVHIGGSSITGHFRNRVGRGWSPVDGYGVVDAQRAVLGA